MTEVAITDQLVGLLNSGIQQVIDMAVEMFPVVITACIVGAGFMLVKRVITSAANSIG